MRHTSRPSPPMLGLALVFGDPSQENARPSPASPSLALSRWEILKALSLAPSLAPFTFSRFNFAVPRR